MIPNMHQMVHNTSPYLCVMENLHSRSNYVVAIVVADMIVTD